VRSLFCDLRLCFSRLSLSSLLFSALLFSLPSGSVCWRIHRLRVSPCIAPSLPSLFAVHPLHIRTRDIAETLLFSLRSAQPLTDPHIHTLFTTNSIHTLVQGILLSSLSLSIHSPSAIMRRNILLSLTGLFAFATLSTSASLTPIQDGSSLSSSSSSLLKRTGSGGGGGYSYCADNSDKLVFKNGQCACKSNKPQGWTLCEGPDTASSGKAVCGSSGCNILCTGNNVVLK